MFEGTDDGVKLESRVRLNGKTLVWAALIVLGADIGVSQNLDVTSRMRLSILEQGGTEKLGGESASLSAEFRLACDGVDAETSSLRWRMIRQLSHPSLLRVFDLRNDELSLCLSRFVRKEGSRGAKTVAELLRGNDFYRSPRSEKVELLSHCLKSGSIEWTSDRDLVRDECVVMTLREGLIEMSDSLFAFLPPRADHQLPLLTREFGTISLDLKRGAVEGEDPLAVGLRRLINEGEAALVRNAAESLDFRNAVLYLARECPGSCLPECEGLLALSKRAREYERARGGELLNEVPSFYDRIAEGVIDPLAVDPSYFIGGQDYGEMLRSKDEVKDVN